MYSEKVIEHFMCPQNAYSMPDADAEGSFGDPSCGDALTIFIKVQDNCIKEISFLVFGCCASIATSSMTSVLAKGKSLDDALKISEEDIIKALDGLPEAKVHCSNLGVSALRNAINNYYEAIKTRIKEDSQ
ncbi:iron-sulfur cluster assembly scaffold protein [Desulfosporosinus metallidurans]|uniref:iron-sulfur cluster assembly scaffold protein n=1 Tax=Desulfosporosinus metallidurans TaxID=1888891 RepID=UPI001A9A34A7|nr:iron-sulfur cluster assembly scaffold protein [Desulfosporosinus metallidurans]